MAREVRAAVRHLVAEHMAQVARAAAAEPLPAERAARVVRGIAPWSREQDRNKTMASGMDMLLNAVIKSLGVNPQDFVQYLSQFVNGVNTKLTDFENRLAQMEQNLDELTSTNRTILLLLQKKGN